MKKEWYIILAVLIAFFLVFPRVAVSAAKKPMTVAELALYKGADRQQILEEGAKKEGKLTLYTVSILAQSIRPIVAAFQNKYPYIKKVNIWRAGSAQIVPRVLEEYKAGKHDVDVLDLGQTGVILIEGRGILQPFYSPNLVYIDENTIKKAPDGGAVTIGHWANYISVGYNTRLLPKDQVPKIYQDLLNPNWKGKKMAITASSTTVCWMGTMLETFGEDFVKQVAKQEFEIHMVSARALLDMVIAGEYKLSPTIRDSHVSLSKEKGAPVEWVPLEPVAISPGSIMLPKHSANPHAALLFIDFDLSKEGGEIWKAAGKISYNKEVLGQMTSKSYFGPRSMQQYTKWKKLFDKLFLKQ
ncbi:ABC transporter substrate-binding protein [Thermodesulfobacteriota bacterium]